MKYLKIEIQGKELEVNALNRNELSADLIQQWDDLETRSMEGNAYLSPHFILPAIKYLTPNTEAIFIFVTHIVGNTRILAGMGVFEYVHGSKQFPLPHLRAYRCPHSYLSGLLVDEAFADVTLIAFFTFFSKVKRLCCGVEFMKRNGDTGLSNKIESIASQLSFPWYQYKSQKRAILIPSKMRNDNLGEILSGNMKKNVKRGWNSLLKMGEVRWNVMKGTSIDKECIERFLNLEHMGWKGANGSSLLSTAEEANFFREMMTGFAQNERAIFAELTLNNRAISSTSNLISARSGYAFKVGWDPEFSAVSPGILNEVELIKNAAEIFPNIEYIDSGAEDGSYLQKLWVDSYSIVSGIFVTNQSAKYVAEFFKYARNMKRRFSKSEA